MGMLVLSRRRDETIVIGDDIAVTVVDIRGDVVRLGDAAPRDIPVHREEIYQEIRRGRIAKGEPMTTRETQRSIGEWSVATFGSSEGRGPAQCLRLLSEVVELCLAAGASRNTIDDMVEEELYKHHLKLGGPPLEGWYSDRPYPEPDKVPEEMADCHVVLRVIAHEMGIDLDAETDAKMSVNRHEREWISNGDGTGRHRKSGDVR